MQSILRLDRNAFDSFVRRNYLSARGHDLYFWWSIITHTFDCSLQIRFIEHLRSKKEDLAYRKQRIQNVVLLEEVQ